MMKKLFIILPALLLWLMFPVSGRASTQSPKQVVLPDKVCEWDETSIYFAFRSDFTQGDAWEQESELNNYFSNTPGYENVSILMEKTSPSDPYVNMDIYIGDNYRAEERIYHIDCSIFKLTIIQKPFILHNVSLSKSGSLDTGNAALSVANMQSAVTYHLFCNGLFLQEIYSWQHTIPVTQQGIYTVQAVVYNENDYPPTIAQGPIVMPGSVSFYHAYAPLAGGAISGPQEYYSGIDNQVVINNLSDATGGNPFWNWAYTYSWEILNNSTWVTLPGETNAYCSLDLYGRWGDIQVRRKVVRGDETAYSNTHIIRSREGSSQVALNNMTIPYNQKNVSFVFDGYYALSEYISAENTLKRYFSETHGLQNTQVVVQRTAENDKKVYVEINLGQSNYTPADKVFHLECNLFTFVLTQTGITIHEVTLSKSGSLSAGNAMIMVPGAQPEVTYNLFCNGAFVRQFPGIVTFIPVTEQGFYTLEALILNPDLPGNPVIRGPVAMLGELSFFYDYLPLSGGTISCGEKYVFGIPRGVSVYSTADPTDGNSFWNYAYSWEVLVNSVWTILPGETSVNCTVNLDRFIGDIHIRRKVVRGEETAYSNTHIIKGIDTTNQITLDNHTYDFSVTSTSFMYDGYYPLPEYTRAQDILCDYFTKEHGIEYPRVYVERVLDMNRKVYVEIEWETTNYWPHDKVYHMECNLFKFDIIQKGLIVKDVSLVKSGSLAGANATVKISMPQQDVYYRLFCNGLFLAELSGHRDVPVTQEGVYTVEALVYNLDKYDWINDYAPIAQGPIPMSGSVSFSLDDEEEEEEMENPELSLSQTHNYITHFLSYDGSASSGSLSVQYYDSLGRPNQTVQFAASPTKKDLVTYQEYDAAGRTSNAWLPVIASANNGRFIPLNSFIDKANSTYANDTKSYSKPVYESSPLNRILEQYGPGKEWHDTHHSVKTGYLTNLTSRDSLNCIRYEAVDATSDTIITINRLGNYEDNQLYVTRTTDEDGNASFEFKDKLGQLVLHRQVTEGDNPYHDTYYIYDSYGNLKAVLPPMASDMMKTGTSWSTHTTHTGSPLNDYAYLYRYDHRNRCIEKKLPGANWIHFIYDKADRLIFSQDGKQRDNHEWAFSIPDIFGREVLSGICKTINGMSTVNRSDFENSIVVASYNESGLHHNYVVKKDADMLDLGTPVYLVTNYYDDYSFMSQNGFSGLIYTLPAGADVGFDTRDTDNNATKGLLTGTIIGDASGGMSKDYGVLYYDYRGRVIQRRNTNHLVGTETECFIYNFIGNPEKMLHIHKQTNSTSEIRNLYSYNYDHAGRLLSTSHQLDNESTVILATHKYDELGRLKIKRNHSDNDINSKLTYNYNVRSWLTSITGTHFSQELDYNQSLNGSPKLYNGNIGTMKWKAGNETTFRGYTFNYDPLSRLTSAVYGEGDNLSQNSGHYSVPEIRYDKHGNMTALKRWGKSGLTNHNLIDDLTFTYNGNQLKHISDAGIVPSHSGTFQFVNRPNDCRENEYIYDSNGNLKADFNKKIADIQYNYLNLPKSVLFEDGNRIDYVYDATGIKKKVTYWDAGSSVPTSIKDYCGSVIYENGVLDKILTPEGYITKSGSTAVYHYYLKDHLGNNRVVLHEDGVSVEQVNHYYPFGGLFEQTNEDVQRYKYNGKELDRTHGMDLYDYSARFMDGKLGRFTTMDPMAEKYYSWSPYHYAGNNPVKYVDPTGMDYWSTNNPEEIKRFLLAANPETFKGGPMLENFDYSSWNHATDAEFTGNLTFNDKTNTFYSSYGYVESDGTPTIVGISIQAFNASDKNAVIEGPGSRWLTRASGSLNNTYPEFDIIFGGFTNVGRALVRCIFSPMSTTNTFNAGSSGFISGGGKRKEKMGKAKGNMSGNREVQNKQIDDLSRKYKLTDIERQELHRMISKEGYGYHEIDQLIKDFFR